MDLIHYWFFAPQTSTKPAILENKIKNVPDKRKGRQSATTALPTLDDTIDSPAFDKDSSKEQSKSLPAVLPAKAPTWQEISVNWRALPGEYLKLSKIRLTCKFQTFMDFKKLLEYVCVMLTLC